MTSSTTDKITTAPGSQSSVTADTPRYLRIVVDAPSHRDGGRVHVDVRVPIKLIRVGARFVNFIPVDARRHVNEALRKEGMDVDLSQMKAQDLNELIDQVQETSIDIDDEAEDVKVTIHAE